MKPYWDNGVSTLYRADAREIPLPDKSVHVCVTSPPYWGLRDYGLGQWEGGDAECGHINYKLTNASGLHRDRTKTKSDGMRAWEGGNCWTCGASPPRDGIGLEPTLGEWVANIVAVMREVRRVLRDDGCVFLNLGDSYAGGRHGGKGGKELPDSHGDGQTSDNLCGECAAILQSRNPGTYIHLVEESPLSVSVSNPVHKGQDFARPENSHSTSLADQNEVGFSDSPPSLDRADVQSRASQASMLDESSQRPQATPHQSGNSFSSPSPACSLTLDVQESERKLDDSPVLPSHTAGTSTPCEEPETDNQGTSWYCSRCGTLCLTPYRFKHIVPHRNLPPKTLVGQPWRVAFALQDDGWILRSAIVWHKPNPMPESTTDRPTSSYEMVFLLSKQGKYFYDAEAVRELSDRLDCGKSRRAPENNGDHGMNGRPGAGNGTANARNVWTIPTQGRPDAHFATFPDELPRRCILAGTSEHGVCGECGAPWVRVANVEGGRGGDWRSEGMRDKHAVGHRGSASAPTIRRETTGWQPTCDCVHWYCATCASVVDYKYDQDKRQKHPMPRMPAGVHKGQTRDEAVVLQSGLLPKGAAATGDSLQRMRQGISASSTGSPDTEPLLLEGLCGSPQRADTSDDEGLDGHDQGVQAPTAPQPSQRIEGRVHHGAPTCDGGTSRTPTPSERSRSPSKWAQARQSHRELATNGQEDARRASEANVLRDMPVLPDGIPSQGQCPHCGCCTFPSRPPVEPARVLDPFVGSGTTVAVAQALGRRGVGLDLNPEYLKIAAKRIGAVTLPLMAS